MDWLVVCAAGHTFAALDVFQSVIVQKTTFDKKLGFQNRIGRTGLFKSR